jgi:DNA-binding GntR family transcriptional regulator
MRVSFDSYVLDTLMRDLVGHDRSPAAFLVYLTLWRLTGGRKRTAAVVSHRELAEETGLSKSAVQGALRRLTRRRLVVSRKASATAVPHHFVARPWVR